MPFSCPPGVNSSSCRTADRVFRGCLLYTSALTLFWLFLIISRRKLVPFAIFSRYNVDTEALRNVFFGFLFFAVFWGYVWYGVKNLLLRVLAGFSKEERRLSFSSRMDQPFDLSALLARRSERRIRIVDMIGRRGRFITLQLSFFYYLYTRIAAEPTPAFLTLALQDSLSTRSCSAGRRSPSTTRMASWPASSTAPSRA